MSLVFFLFVTTLFLFFFANVILSPERNPRFVKLMEAEHAPSKEAVTVIVALCNGAGIGLAVVLVVAVPFLRVLAAMAMVGWTIRFFHRRHFGTSGGRSIGGLSFFEKGGSFGWCDQDPRPERHVGNHSESDDQSHDRGIEEPTGHGSPGAARGVPGYQPSSGEKSPGAGGETSQ